MLLRKLCALYSFFILMCVVGCQLSETGLENLMDASNSSTQQQTQLVKPSGYELPPSFSMVPVVGVSTASSVGGLIGTLFGGGNELSLETDYYQSISSHGVYEPMLEQFGLIQNLLQGLAQTHFAAKENVNSGAYAARVHIKDDTEVSQKSIQQHWVVDSLVETKDGETDIHRVHAWITSYTSAGPELMKLDITIYSPAYVNIQGAVTDFGQWDLRLRFPARGNDFVAAQVRYIDKQSVISINSNETYWNADLNTAIVLPFKAQLYRGKEAGHGRVNFADKEYCQRTTVQNPTPCSQGVPQRQAYLAYNDQGMSLQLDNDPVLYRDRRQSLNLSTEYGLYNKTTGEDIRQTYQFEFPISFLDDAGETQWARYAAHSGRHYLRTQPGVSPPSLNSEVIRRQISGRAIDRTYHVGLYTSGTLFKVEAISAIENNELDHWLWETEFSRHKILKFDAATLKWKSCHTPWSDTSGCGSDNSDWQDIDSLADLSHQPAQALVQYKIVAKRDAATLVYLDDERAASGAGFYHASYHENGQLERIGAPWNAMDDDVIEVQIYGTYLLNKEPDSERWRRASVVDYVTENGLPLTDGVYQSHAWQTGTYHLRQPGRELILQVDDTQSISKIVQENWQSLHPNELDDSFAMHRALFRNGDSSSQIYQFQTDAHQEHFMSILYANGPQQGQPVEHSLWALWLVNEEGQVLDMEGNVIDREQAMTESNLDTVAQFRWLNRQDDSSAQAFLTDEQGKWVQLEKSRKFDAVPIKRKNYYLSYDSNVHGLIQPLRDLTKLNWQANEQLSKQLVQLKQESQLVDSETGIVYMVKPLNQFNVMQPLATNQSGAPELSVAKLIDWQGLPPQSDSPLTNSPITENYKYIDGLIAD